MSYVLDEAQLRTFAKNQFPQMAEELSILWLSGRVHMRLRPSFANLRPGGTVSGPSLFALGDIAFYLELMAHIGPKALAVTTSASIDFMRKPAADQDIIAKPRILKLGRVLAVGDVLIYSEGPNHGEGRPLAHANFTYSIPPEIPA